MYESLSTVHGRPTPLRGKLYATLYIHFIPLMGISSLLEWQHHKDKDSSATQKIEEWYKLRQKESNTAIFNSVEQDRLPHFISPESTEAERWLQKLRYTQLPSNAVKEHKQTKVSAAHYAAIYNDLRALKNIGQGDKSSLFASDDNGWTPLHEAVRAGHTRIVQFLLQQGADVNQRTQGGRGESPLHLAITTFNKDHPVVKVLEQHGGKDIPPRWIQNEDSKDTNDSGEEDELVESEDEYEPGYDDNHNEDVSDDSVGPDYTIDEL